MAKNHVTLVKEQIEFLEQQKTKTISVEDACLVARTICDLSASIKNYCFNEEPEQI